VASTGVRELIVRIVLSLIGIVVFFAYFIGLGLLMDLFDRLRAAARRRRSRVHPARFWLVVFLVLVAPP
jgi:hypothetical protein